MREQLYAILKPYIPIQEVSKVLDEIMEVMPQWISVEDGLPKMPQGEISIKVYVIREGYEDTIEKRWFTQLEGWKTLGKVLYWAYKDALPQPPEK